MSSEGPLKKQELQYLILSYLYIYDGAYRFLSSFAPVSDHHFEGDQNDFERSQSSFCDGLERLTKYYFCNKNNTRELFYGDKFVSGDVLDNISYIYTNIINNPKIFRRTGKKLYINKNEITDICDELLEWALYLFKDLNKLLNLYSFYGTADKNLIKEVAHKATAVKGMIFASSMKSMYKEIDDINDSGESCLFYRESIRSYYTELPEEFYKYFYNPALKWLEDESAKLSGGPQATETLFNTSGSDLTVKTFEKLLYEAIVTEKGINFSNQGENAKLEAYIKGRKRAENKYRNFYKKEIKELKENITSSAEDSRYYSQQVDWVKLEESMADFDLSGELLPEEAKEILTKKDSEFLKPIVLGENKSTNTNTPQKTLPKRESWIKRLINKIKYLYYRSDIDKEIDRSRKAKRKEEKKAAKAEKKYYAKSKPSFSFHLPSISLSGSFLFTLGICGAMLLLSGILLILSNTVSAPCNSFFKTVCNLCIDGKTFFKPFFICNAICIFIGKLLQSFIFVLLSFVLWPFYIIALLVGVAADLILLLVFYVLKFIFVGLFVVILAILFYILPIAVIVASIIIAIKYLQNADELNAIDFVITIISVIGTIAMCVLYYCH